MENGRIRSISIFYCLFSLFAVSSTQAASYPYSVNGDKAKAFFQQFQKTSPNDYPLPNAPDVNFNIVASSPDLNTYGYRWWYVTPAAPLLAITSDGGVPATMHADPQGGRYFEQIGYPLLYENQAGWGYFFVSPTDNSLQMSQNYTSALHANRYSILFQAPDEVIAPGGSIINVNTDPAGYMNTLMFQKGYYGETDGFGSNPDNSNAENNDWHYYFNPGGYWLGHPYDAKLEALGNHFKRLTFSDLNIVQRTSAPHLNFGIYGADAPETRLFDGDDAAMMRDETRMYLTIGYAQAKFVKTDTTGASGDIFQQGLPVFHLYGTSFWYEDPEVDVVAFPPSDPEGTPFVQVAADPSVTPTITIPFQIRNHSAANNSYTVFIPYGNIPIWDPAQSDSSGVILYTDDGTGNPGTRLGANVSVPPGGVLPCIMQLNTSHISPSNTGNGVGDREVSVALNNPNDPMSLKGASLIIFTYFAGNAPSACAQNIWMYSGTNTAPPVACPANQAPQVSIQSSITEGQSVPAGTSLQIQNAGIKPEPANGLSVYNRFYLPDGHSLMAPQGQSITYVPWRIGANTILVQSGDGVMRSFDTLNFTVTRGANGPPQARINIPATGVTYKAGDEAMFAAWSSPVDNHNPDGGNPGTLYGITNFNWNFGDGTPTVNNQYPAHVYASPGTYTVALTVTDDEGRHASVSQPLTITPPDHPPVANIQVVNPQLNRQFGAVQLTASGSADPDGASDITEYLWSFTGPNGYNDSTNQVYVNEPPLYLFNAWEAGDYTVNLTVIDHSGAQNSTSTVVNVPPWDGLYRADIIAADTGPGGSAFNFDVGNITQGWPLIHPIQSGAPPARIGLAGTAPVQILTNGLYEFRNGANVPPQTPAALTGIFSSAEGPAYAGAMHTISNLPRGLYNVTAYMYASNFNAPGTQYLVNFSTLTVSLTIPPSATYRDFIVTGTLIHPGGDLAVTGYCYLPSGATTCQYTNNTLLSPLAGFTLQPVAGPPPVVSMTSPADGSTSGSPAYLTLSANATSPTGSIVSVNFYANSVLIGSGTVDHSGTNYSYAWNNVPTGTYALTVQAADNAGQTTTTSPITFTVSPPNPVSFSLKGNASELSAIANGATVTPQVAPAGLVGQAAILGTGSIAFSPAFSGDGVSFQVNGQQQVNTAFYQFKGPLLGNIFNPNQGDMTFYVKSNLAASARESHNVYVMDVWDDSKELFSFTMQGFALYYQTGGTSSQSYVIPASQQEVLFGLGKVLKVRLAWDGHQNTLFLNENLITQQSYTPATPNWTAKSLFTVGSSAAYGGGFFCDDDAIADFQATAPDPNQPWVMIASPANNATFGPPPATIPITAAAGIGVGSISQVDFYQGANWLGTATNPPYTFSWNNVPLGTYNLSAQVTAGSGVPGVSSIVTVTVSNNPPPIISTFTASPAVISSGQSSTLAWAVSGATSTSIDHGVGDVTNQTSVTVSPSQTAVYTLTAANAYGSVTQHVTVTVNAPGGGPGPGPGPNPLPRPDLSKLDGNTYPLSEPISFSYPVSGVTFGWEFVPSASVSSGMLSSYRRKPVPSTIDWAPASAPYPTSAPRFTPLSAGLAPGTYTLTVTVTQGSQSVSATATITLVASDLSGLKVYPNPWRADRHAAHSSIIFANLPIGSTVRLFSTSGHQVKELNESGGQTTWDLTNDSGDKVASGIYIYLIKDSQGDKVKGKVGIIR